MRQPQGAPEAQRRVLLAATTQVLKHGCGAQPVRVNTRLRSQRTPLLSREHQLRDLDPRFLLHRTKKTDWGYAGNAPFLTAESWLDRPLTARASPRDLVLRYLAAFGPGSAADVRAWSGMTSGRVREALDELRSELLVFPAQRGTELFDLPDAPRPPADTPAPPRLLPEFDNLLFAWRDRSRVMSEEHRRRLSNPPLMHPSFLLDGFVAGEWRIEKARRSAALVIEPFTKVGKADEEALAHEGERLLRFLEPDAEESEVRLAREGGGSMRGRHQA